MTSIILLSINFGKRSWKLWKRLVLLLYESNNLVPRAFPLKNGWGGKSCYRVVLRLKFIVTVELLYDQAESDFVQCQTKMRAFASRICSEFKQIELNWNRIVHQNRPPRKAKNCKSPGIWPGGIVTSQIEPCITYQMAKGANTLSTDICQRGACYL